MATHILDRLADKIAVGDGCWEWRGTRMHEGYGVLKVGSQRDGTRRTVRAHRAVYELLKGPIPEGLGLDHLCRNRGCVRPDHLEPVTSRVNSQRGMLATATHCHAGHKFDEKNTYWRPTGGRACRLCRREAVRRYDERRKAK